MAATLIYPPQLITYPDGNNASMLFAVDFTNSTPADNYILPGFRTIVGSYFDANIQSYIGTYGRFGSVKSVQFTLRWNRNQLVPTNALTVGSFYLYSPQTLWLYSLPTPNIQVQNGANQGSVAPNSFELSGLIPFLTMDNPTHLALIKEIDSDGASFTGTGRFIFNNFEMQGSAVLR